MKIESAIARPRRKLFEVIVHDVVGSDDRHIPPEPGAAPRPIKVGIGKRKIYGIESTALLPGFAPNQERAGENHVTRPPANSVADLPGGVVRSVQIQLPCEILSKRER